MSQFFAEETDSGGGLLWANRVAAMPSARFYLIAALVLLVMGGVQAISLREDAEKAYAVYFGCLAIALQLCAWCCVPYVRASRGARGSLCMRWALFLCGISAASLCYTLACLEQFRWVQQGPLQFWLLFSSNVAEALCLMAAAMSFSGASRSMTLLDWIQALLFGVLRFALTYTPRPLHHVIAHNLNVKFWVSLALLLIGWIASAGASSQNERRFLRLLSGYLAVRTISLFLAYQVAFLFLHHDHANGWDIPVTLLFLGYALFMARTWRRPVPASPLKPKLMVRNLMPSFLVLINLVLAFCALRLSSAIGIMAALLAMGCYILRTVLLQEQISLERESLLSRNELLEALAERDALTGVGNRRSLASAYDRLASAPGQALALLLVDTDNFKQANDRFGHLYGDQVLVNIASVLRQVGGRFPASHCARFGGDEFSLYLAGITPEEALQAAEAIRSGVQALGFEGGEESISVSLGGALTISGAKLTLEDLLSRADDALYRAKANGRNCVEWDDLPPHLKDRAAKSARMDLMSVVS